MICGQALRDANLNAKDLKCILLVGGSTRIPRIKEILVDCDSDAIIYLVEPSGPACHTGERVCFHHSLEK